MRDFTFVLRIPLHLHPLSQVSSTRFRAHYVNDEVNRGDQLRAIMLHTMISGRLLCLQVQVDLHAWEFGLVN
jgi:hypothetical protein